MELRRPVVLVGGVDLPGRSQVAAGRVSDRDDGTVGGYAAVCRRDNAITRDAEAQVSAPLKAPVGRVVALGQVGYGALSIGDLGLEVVALSNKREVQAQAGAND